MVSLVINLPHRVDRYKEFIEEVKWIQLLPLVVDGIEHEIPQRGIGQAHCKCIQYAKENTLPFVIIMEDDVVFQGKQKTYPYFIEAMENSPNDWDILLGGVYNRGPVAKYNNYWDKIAKFCGLHFYIVNAKAYDKLLAWNGVEHFDRFIAKAWLNCYVTSKYIAHQKDGYSDNSKTHTRYNEEHLDQHRLLI